MCPQSYEYFLEQYTNTSTYFFPYLKKTFPKRAGKNSGVKQIKEVLKALDERYGIKNGTSNVTNRK